jgi:ribosome maturation factor RimP
LSSQGPNTDMPKSLVDAQKLEALVAPACTALGLELVDVRHQVESEGPVLRVLIERPGAESAPKGTGGVTLDECTAVSRAVSALLDENEDLIPGAFRLEVSSPGVERPLVKPRDFERYAGREVKLATSRIVAARKHFSGTLVGLRGDEVLLTDGTGTEYAVPFSAIQKAHLVYRF